MSKTGGGRGTNQYQIKGRSIARDRNVRGTRAEPEVDLQIPREYRATPVSHLGFPSESDLGVQSLCRTSVERVAERYMSMRAEFAFASGHLEGNSFTLPEVYTLLDGRAPEGRTHEEIDQILALTEASENLLDSVRAGTFRLDLDHADRMNKLLSQYEAISPGVRRAHSPINSDGRGATVNVMGDIFTGYNKTELESVEVDLLERTAEIRHPAARAFVFAAGTAYAQMYFDGNKRTGRYMADGELMSHGFDAVAIPAKRRSEYQHSVAEMFRTADLTPYASFLADVARNPSAVA